MPIKTKSSDPYAAKRTNLYLDPDLVKIAQAHFPTTGHRSLSGFVKNKLRQMIRTDAAKLRKAGHKLPASLFTK